MLEVLSSEECENLHHLLRDIVDRESGAFVLFGSKPLCTAFIETNPKNSLHSLETGWEAWDKIKPFINRRYILTRRGFTVMIDESKKLELQLIVLADAKKTASMLKKHYDFFKSFIGSDFDPHQLVFELENPHSLFWNQIFDLENQSPKGIFNGNKACGLLFGFGLLNSTRFALEANVNKNLFRKGSLHNYGEKNLIWANFFYERGFNTFLIPGFIAFDGDTTIKKYKKERKKIQSIYKGRDFLKVTLQKFGKKKPSGEKLAKPVLKGASTP